MSVEFPRYLCIHGHFYQPPRENPWLEAVEVQDSAAPYHDWNERITRECYGPNSRARLVDGSGKIIGLINNYAWMSFNFGPTLLDWMREGEPDVLRGIVEGDRLGRERRNGHGNALAQVYNHIIMPLASDRDRRTQVHWGIADFRHYFGHEPEGMWLAEAAADTPSLEALAAAGIRFTILAPRQAKRWRRIGEGSWPEIAEGIDPSRAYLCRLPSGRSITLFFYDDTISRQVAFERLLDSGEKFFEKLLQGFDAKRQHAQLVHVATDGESYGHHHAHGDMALAYVLEKLRKDPTIHLTNYGEFLDLHPPEWEVEIHENSSWSCVHGVERWRSDCGCNSGRGWHQKWRGPLRQAFDDLKKKLDQLYERAGGEYLSDPWSARNDYIGVTLDRSEESVSQFVQRHGKRHGPIGLGRTEINRILWLLEMQRHSLLMYTSCGWFFDEISGLETTQCLRYAARAIQLARHFNQDFEDHFVQALEKAPSNLASYKNGRGVWEQLIRPAKVDLDRVLAHHAIALLYRAPEPDSRVYCYDLESHDCEIRSRGESHLGIGRLRVRSRLTWNEAETSFVVLHYGGLDFHTVLRQSPPEQEYQSLAQKLQQLFETGSLADVTELIVHSFQGDSHRLDDLFTEERRRIINIVLQQRSADYQQAFERLADQDDGMLAAMARLHYPIPRAFGFAAALALDHRLLQEIDALRNDGDLPAIKQRIERGRLWGYEPGEPKALARKLEQLLSDILKELPSHADVPSLTERAGRVLDLAAWLGLPLDFWQAQNQLLDAYTIVADLGSMPPALCRAFAHLAERLNVSRDLLGWRP
jgi:alpha-amylase/alpha-mannosidase (GH57 family)